ncbi:MAG: Ig-like domain-containing protein [Bacteroidales bacterium]|jgi:hypothetical protein|nr:Ig-like domain-containing protein [Bacteroidales bacterium]
MNMLKVKAAVANHGGAMEADTISKNGQSTKSHTSRGHFLAIACMALLAAGNLQAQITAIGNLNTDEPVINSHEYDTGAKLLELNYREYHEIQLISPFNSNLKPTYSRIKKLPNDKYIMFWHINDVGSNILYSISPNLKDWETPKEVFTPIPNITVTVQGENRTDRRVYNNGDALVLQNGYLMAVASFRANSNMYNTNDGNGIAMRISTDNGQSWGEEKVIFRGSNWEPQILQLPSGEIQVYFTHSSTNNQMQFDQGIIGDAVVRSSGTAILRSTDNGETWVSHLPENEFYGYVVAQRYNKTENNVNRYTHQMPCAVLLNNSNTIALALEDQNANDAGYTISIAYSDDNWAHYLSPNSVYNTIEEGPEDKQKSLWSGSGPYLKQFPSGETVISYSANNKYSIRLGNAEARTFAVPYLPFRYDGYWGALEPDGSHTMIGTITTGQITTNTRHILIGKMQLNHTIFPARSTPTIDGNNNDWSNNTDAFFVGSDSQAQAAVRMTYDDDNLYLLVERLDDDLLPSDVLDVYLHTGAELLNSSSLRLKIGAEGVQQISRYAVGNWVNSEIPEIQSESLLFGTVSNSGDSDEGYIAEIAVPRSTIQAYGSLVKIALVLLNQDDGTDVMADGLNNVNVNQPNGWLNVNGIITHVTGVTVDPETLYLTVGSSETLTATVEPEDAENKTVSWMSDNENVATVSDDGTVTAVAAGAATITATAQVGKLSAACAVTVTNTTTGVKISDTPIARIYPNPTEGMLTLDFETAGERHITLSDVAGKVLLRQTVSEPTIRIDISNYPAGVYLVTINDGKKQKTVRVILL